MEVAQGKADGGCERLGDEFLSVEQAFFKREGVPFYFQDAGPAASAADPVTA